MPLIATALVGLLFLPGSATAPIAEAKTTAPSALASGEEPSSRRVAPPITDATTQTVMLTSYNAVPEQTDEDPTVTASGIPSNPKVIAARSHDLARSLPFGTIIAIYRSADDTPGCNFKKVEHLIGYRVIADTMNARFTKRVDVEFDQTDKVKVDGVRINPAVAMGLCRGVTIRVVGFVSTDHVPQTQEGLARYVFSKELALSK